MAFKIIKKVSGFWHNNGFKEVNLSDWEIILESVGQTVVLEAKNGANFPQKAVGILDVIVVDETASSFEETFTNVEDLRLRLVALGYNPYQSATGIPEAPIDGNTYGRKDGDWEAITGGGSTPSLQGVSDVDNTLTDTSIISQSSTVDRYTIYSDNGLDLTNNDTGVQVLVNNDQIGIAQGGDNTRLVPLGIEHNDTGGQFNVKFRPNTNLGGDFYFKDATGTDEDIAFVSDIPTDYIPLSGTESGSPVTGNIELEDTNVNFSTLEIFRLSNGTNKAGLKFFDDNTFIIGSLDNSLSDGNYISLVNGLLLVSKTGGLSSFLALNSATTSISSEDSAYRGFSGDQDFTPNITDLDYTQKIYVDGSTQRTTATSGTFTPTDAPSDLIIIHEAGTTTSLTIDLPTVPRDKQKVTIMSVGGIIGLTLSTAVGSIIGTITSLTALGSVKFVWLESESKWYKIN